MRVAFHARIVLLGRVSEGLLGGRGGAHAPLRRDPGELVYTCQGIGIWQDTEGSVDVPPASNRPRSSGLPARTWALLGALPAGLAVGAICGAVFGGVGGRIVMHVIALIDTSTDGAETDFATVGEITAGGILTLVILCTIAGMIGGATYVGLRRWIPWASSGGRGVFLGLLLMFGPGVIFLGEVDLQIFEPAVPFYAMFIALVVVYGVCVALITDRLHPARAVRPGRRAELASRLLVGLAAVGILFMAAATTYNVNDKAGTCLTADGQGGCGLRSSDR